MLVLMDTHYAADMCDPSTVLTPEMAKSLFGRMPPKIQNQPWKLAFSTQSDGFSLQNLYRTLADEHDEQVNIILKNCTVQCEYR